MDGLGIYIQQILKEYPSASVAFQVSLEDGTVRGHDIRTGGSVTRPTKGSTSKAVYTIHAHEKAVCSISYNQVAPNVSDGTLSILVVPISSVMVF